MSLSTSRSVFAEIHEIRRTNRCARFTRSESVEWSSTFLLSSPSGSRLAIGQYLHSATLRVAKFTRSQQVVEATAKPHHYYRHQVRRQRPEQRHLRSAIVSAVHGDGLVAAHARAARTCTLVRLDVYPRRRLDLMDDWRRRLLRWFRLRFYAWPFVAGALLEAVLVVGERTVARTATGTVPRFVCHRKDYYRWCRQRERIVIIILLISARQSPVSIQSTSCPLNANFNLFVMVVSAKIWSLTIVALGPTLRTSGFIVWDSPSFDTGYKYLKKNTSRYSVLICYVVQ